MVDQIYGEWEAQRKRVYISLQTRDASGQTPTDVIYKWIETRTEQGCSFEGDQTPRLLLGLMEVIYTQGFLTPARNFLALSYCRPTWKKHFPKVKRVDLSALTHSLACAASLGGKPVARYSLLGYDFRFQLQSTGSYEGCVFISREIHSLSRYAALAMGKQKELRYKRDAENFERYANSNKRALEYLGMIQQDGSLQMNSRAKAGVRGLAETAAYTLARDSESLRAALV